MWVKNLLSIATHDTEFAQLVADSRLVKCCATEIYNGHKRSRYVSNQNFVVVPKSPRHVPKSTVALQGLSFDLSLPSSASRAEMTSVLSLRKFDALELQPTLLLLLLLLLLTPGKSKSRNEGGELALGGAILGSRRLDNGPGRCFDRDLFDDLMDDLEPNVDPASASSSSLAARDSLA
jgi:hypothetical protein